MPAKLSTDSFLSVLKRSRLVAPDLLDEILGRFRERGNPLEDPQDIADALVSERYLTQWQAKKLLQGMYKGFFLGKYRLLSLLGKGGMSSVYLAEHVLMRRRCAIKVLPFNRVDNASYLARFHREAQAVAAMDHPNIVRAYDVDVDKDVEKQREVHFLVMEYVNGRSLQELIPKDGPLGFVRAADYVRQAADGLQHAHQAGMVHRDIKPGNLLVDKNGLVKVLDLGLARFFDDQDEESLTVEHDHKVLGTADYLAPEQALDSHSVDERADIYSLGCTFYYLLTGRPPFTDGTLAQRLMSHQTKKPPPIAQFREDVPAGLVEIIEKMMAKNPSDRYQTAEDVSRVVCAWLKRNAGDDWNPPEQRTISRESESELQQPLPPDVTGETMETISTLGDDDNEVDSLSKSGGNDERNLASFLSNLDGSSGNSEASTSNANVPESGETQRTTTLTRDDSVPVAKTEKRADFGEVPNKVPVARPVDSPSPSSLPVAKPVPPGEPVSTMESVSEEAELDTNEFPVFDPTEPVPEIFSKAHGEGQIGSAGKKKRPTQSPRGKNTAKNLLIVTVLILVVGGVGYALFLFLKEGSKPAEKTASGKLSAAKKQTKRTVEPFSALPRVITVGPQSEFKTIAGAVARVKETFKPRNRRDRQIIIVQGGHTYTERISIDNSDKSFEDIRIHLISEGEKPAVLAPPATDEPVFTLKDVKQFVLDGFELDAGGAKTAVELNGFLLGTQLRNLKINGFTEAGLSGRQPGGIGAENEQIVLENIDFRAAAPDAAGIRFLEAEDDPAHIIISHCRFIGPMSTGILLQGGAAFVRVQNSIFSNLKTGIRFESTSPVKLRQVAIERNTFHQLETAISLFRMPQTYPNSNETAIRGNYLVNVSGIEAVIQNRFDEIAFMRIFTTNGLANNGTTRPKSNELRPGELDLIGERGMFNVTPKFRSLNPEDAGFLLPTEQAAHRGVGAAAPK